MKKLFAVFAALCLVLILLPVAANAEATGNRDVNPEKTATAMFDNGDSSSLMAPTAKVTNVASSGKLKISWDKVEGAVKYQVYRSTGQNGTYKLLSTVRGTSLTNTSATVGNKYYYYVIAVSEDNVKSGKSNIVSRVCDLPCPVVKISVVSSSGKLKLSWDKVEGASRYEVHRSTDGGETYKLLKTTTGTSLTNTTITAGNKYHYKVKAIHSNSSASSAFSAVKSGTCDLPQPVLKISVVSSSGKLKLSWDKVEGASRYEVHRSTDGGETYKLLKTTTGTSLTNTTITVGNKYYYKVMAIHSNSSANSAFSAAKSGTCDLARPDVSVKLSSGKPKLSWNEITKASKYYIYCATSENGDYVKIGTTTGTSYTDRAAESGKTYYYKVKAIYSDNTAANSAYSSVVKIKVESTEVKFISYPETVARNEIATVEFQGKPNTEYAITVYYKSGASTADGLEPKISDDNGYVSWTWKVGGRTSPGTFKIVISGGGESKTVYFTVVE